MSRAVGVAKHGKEVVARSVPGADRSEFRIYLNALFSRSKFPNTPDAAEMGKPGSIGCVRARNRDIIGLFDLVPPSMPDEIRA